MSVVVNSTLPAVSPLLYWSSLSDTPDYSTLAPSQLSRMRRRSRPGQISLDKLRWTPVLYSSSTKSLQLGTRSSLQFCQSCDVKKSRHKWKVFPSMICLTAWVLARSRPVFKLWILRRFATDAISSKVHSIKPLHRMYSSASIPHSQLIRLRDPSQRLQASFPASMWTLIECKSVSISLAVHQHLQKERSAQMTFATQVENEDAPLKKRFIYWTISDQTLIQSLFFGIRITQASISSYEEKLYPWTLTESTFFDCRQFPDTFCNIINLKTMIV